MQHYHDLAHTGAVIHLDPWRRARSSARPGVGQRRHVDGLTEADIALGGVVTPEGAANG